MQLTTYEDGTAFGDGVSKAFSSSSSLQGLKFSAALEPGATGEEGP